MAAEALMSELETDPVWIARRDERERANIERVRQSRLEQVPLLSELKSTGIVVEDVWDLIGSAKPYPDALPVLLDHLLRGYSDSLRDSIARALAVKAARPIAWDLFVDLVRNHSDQRWVAEGVMAAISAMARPSDLDVLIDLITDRSVGSGRIFLVNNLMRAKKPVARQVLQDLRDDPDLRHEIAFRLKRSVRS